MCFHFPWWHEVASFVQQSQHIWAFWLINFKLLFKPLKILPVNGLSSIQIPRETLAIFYDHAPMKAKQGSLQTHIKYSLMLLSCRGPSALIHLLQKLQWIRKSVLSQTHKMPTGFEKGWSEVKLLHWFRWSRGINSMKNALTSHDALSHRVFPPQSSSKR